MQDELDLEKKALADLYEGWKSTLNSCQNVRLTNDEGCWQRYQLLESWFNNVIGLLRSEKIVDVLLSQTDEAGNNIFHLVASLEKFSSNTFHLLNRLRQERHIPVSDITKILKQKNNANVSVFDCLCKKSINFSFLQTLLDYPTLDRAKEVLELLFQARDNLMAISQDLHEIDQEYLLKLLDVLVTQLLEQENPEEDLNKLLDVLVSQDAMLRGFVKTKHTELFLRFLLKIMDSKAASEKVMNLFKQYKTHIGEGFIANLFDDRPLYLFQALGYLRQAGISDQAIAGLVDVEHVETYYGLSKEERLLLSLIELLKRNEVSPKVLIDLFIPSSFIKRPLETFKEKHWSADSLSSRLLLALLDSHNTTNEDRLKLKSFKDQVFSCIAALHENLSTKLAREAIKENTPLGLYFHLQRGFFEPSPNKGTLRKLNELAVRTMTTEEAPTEQIGLISG